MWILPVYCNISCSVRSLLVSDQLGLKCINCLWPQAKLSPENRMSLVSGYDKLIMDEFMTWALILTAVLQVSVCGWTHLDVLKGTIGILLVPVSWQQSTHLVSQAGTISAEVSEQQLGCVNVRGSKWTSFSSLITVKYWSYVLRVRRAGGLFPTRIAAALLLLYLIQVTHSRKCVWVTDLEQQRRTANRQLYFTSCQTEGETLSLVQDQSHWAWPLFSEEGFIISESCVTSGPSC